MKFILLLVLFTSSLFAAVQTATVTALQSPNQKAVRVQWASIAGATSDTGSSVELHQFKSKSIQCEGTYGGTTVTIQASNDGTNWQGVLDSAGSALTFTAAGLKTISTIARYYRPSAASGTGSLTCTLIATLY